MTRARMAMMRAAVARAAETRAHPARRWRVLLRVVTIAVIGMFPPLSAEAQPPPLEARSGLVFAREVCSACHDVEPIASQDSEHNAPAFVEIAADPTWDDAALEAFFQTSHALMPDFVFLLDNQRDENLISYFRYLRASSDGEGLTGKE